MLDRSKTSVTIADDHSLFLEGLASLIHSTPDMQLLGQASSGSEAYTLVKRQQPEVAVLDISMPDFDGITVARRLAGEGCPTKLLALSGHEDQAQVRRALDFGFQGVVVKKSSWANLAFAIRSVAAGGIHIDPRLAGEILGRRQVFRLDHSSDIDGETMRLTSREEEVLRLVAYGFTLKETAAQLGITEKTIETYKSRATQKLRLPSRAKIVQYAISQGWFAH
ncbi:MAG TPA: response regulator transcription factor [Roseiarcus sp.]|jgi:DNA-binding NarL/FixJ family response regulator